MCVLRFNCMKFMRIGLFIPCYINAVYPEVGVAAYKLLRHLGLDVDYPLDQTCCGQPMANAGYQDKATDLALRMERLFETYDYVVGPLRGLREGEPSADLGACGACLPE